MSGGSQVINYGHVMASNTNSATQNTPTFCQYACPGDRLEYNTCGNLVGDAYISLRATFADTIVDSSDDGMMCSPGSEINFLVTGSCDEYCLNAGCYGSNQCEYDLQLTFTPAVTSAFPTEMPVMMPVMEPTSNSGNTGSPGGDHIFTGPLDHTDSAHQNAHRSCYHVCPNEEIIFSTCSTCDTEGDTFFRLFDGTFEIASDDDGCWKPEHSSLHSEIRYTHMASQCSEICLDVGCLGDNHCSAHVEVIRNSHYPEQLPEMSNTASASTNTFKSCHVGCGGETIEFDTCSGVSTDTDMRLFNDMGEFILYDDMGCNMGGTAPNYNSKIVYDVMKPGCHQYCVDVGCFSQSTCSGVLDFNSRLTDPNVPIPPFTCGTEPPNPGGNLDGVGLCGLVHSTNIHNVEKSWTCTGSVPNTPPCGDSVHPPWKGVKCSPEGHVVEINLGFTNHFVEGHIGRSIGLLHHLENLDVRHQRLRRSIPDEIGDLANLKTLDLSTNLLTGPLPPGIRRLKDQGTRINLANNALDFRNPQ